MQQNNDQLNIRENNGGFFRKLDWSAFWTACVISFLMYLYTLAPTVTLEDSGELAVASDYLGVPHPPGYPIWTMITWLFTKVFAFVTYRGQPNPAWSVGLASAVFGALATGMSAMLISRSGSDLLRGVQRVSYTLTSGTENAICWVAAVAGSLVFAFSPVMWSQSVIVEVYSLNAFFLILVFLLTYRWLCRPDDNLLYAAAFVFGLGLTNYQVLLLAGLPLVFAVFVKDLKLFRDFFVVGILYIAVFGLVKFGFLPPIEHPTDQQFVIYMLLNLVVLTFVYFLLPRGKTVAVTLLLFELGVGFYAFMPIVSDLRNPPMNWAYPRTWRGFKHAITRGQYEQIKPTEILSGRFIDQIGSYLADLRKQFTLPVALLGFLPFVMWDVKAGKRRHNVLHLSILLCIVASVLALLEEIFFQHGQLAVVYKPLIAVVLVCVVVGGGTIFVNMCRELFDKLSDRVPSTFSERLFAGLGLLAVILLYAGFLYMVVSKIHAVLEPLGAENADLSGEQTRQLITSAILYGLLVLVPPAIMAAFLWLNMGPLKVDMTLGKDAQKWILAILLGFLALSVMLIVLANPSGDIQDSFIQRVKFISSHALFALWIGYGLVFGLSFLDRLFKGNPAIKVLGLVAAACMAFIPVRENYANNELVRRVGGAEQRGHDFGWQFGNYQLRGADAIIEELDPWEEPPPNPSYPEEMGLNAVFFGGTDPGRFVPTYMIYSARVREDVYLITQNALADNTYLNVMRDLYGDQIWIPSETDSSKAFATYVQEVRSGKRQAKAGINIEGGRVQITGALGVMEINGLLAEMIFKHNRFKHDFYVEESYVLDWMYPYLEPHGLIMKINRSKIDGISDRTVRNDLDFWDWYTKRLITNRKFRRDVVARKSFSKLRSAIAGLYAHSSQTMPENSEHAFHEARALYPLSPEANFRLAQEIYWPQMRLDDAYDLMKEFTRKDPENDKARHFVRRVRKSRKIADQIRRLRKEIGTAPLDDQDDLNKLFKLANLYLQGQFSNQFMGLMKKIVSDRNMPGVYHFRAAQLLYRARQYPLMTRALELCWGRLPDNIPDKVYLQIVSMYAKLRQTRNMARWLELYLENKPDDWRGWLDYAKLQLSMNNSDEAREALRKAVSAGGRNARNAIRQDPAFRQLRSENVQRRPDMFLPRSRENKRAPFPLR